MGVNPRELPQVAELLAARPECEPVGLPSQHGLNIFGPWRSVKNSIVAGIRVSAWHVHLVFITEYRHRVFDGHAWGRPSCPPGSGPLSTAGGHLEAGQLAGRAFPVACSGRSDLT